MNVIVVIDTEMRVRLRNANVYGKTFETWVLDRK